MLTKYLNTKADFVSKFLGLTHFFSVGININTLYGINKYSGDLPTSSLFYSPSNITTHFCNFLNTAILLSISQEGKTMTSFRK